MNTNIIYKELDKHNIKTVIDKYVDYYNNNDNDTWTFETAYKRILQVMTIEDSHCIVQLVDGNLSAFAMGYYKQFDDLLAYSLEEIIVFQGYQRQGYGSHMMLEIEKKCKGKGGSLIELISLNDKLHNYFYGRLGYYDASNLIGKGKFIK